uniref:Uncharacterized protein n=1 Tax=Salix viminalis TaxID=40686 RepID=A0A6N2ML74_SALVM
MSCLVSPRNSSSGKRFRAAYDTAMVAKSSTPFLAMAVLKSISQFIESTHPRFARTVSLAILIGTAFLGSKIAGHHAKRSFLGAYELISNALMALLGDSRNVVEMLLDFAECEFLQISSKRPMMRPKLLVDPSFGNGCVLRNVAAY